jgi:hypothetical protein
MAAQDGGGDEFGDAGEFVVSGFDVVEGVEARLLVFGRLVIPLRDACIELPAVIVEGSSAGASGDVGGELRDEGFDVGEREFFEMDESDDDVGDLDAGVVDVVLDVDGVSGGAQEADEGIAEDGVAKVSDMGGFVGVDGGVLD